MKLPSSIIAIQSYLLSSTDFKLTSLVFFETHNLVYGSSIVSQVPLYLSKLSQNGM